MLRCKIIVILVITLLKVNFSFSQDSIAVEKSNDAFYLLNLGVLAGKSGGDNNYGLSLQGAMGLKITHAFGIGLGVGFEEDNTIKTMPLFFQINGDLLKTSNTPSYYVNIGQSKVWVNEGYGEPSDANFIELGLGYKWQLNKHKIFISSGWKYQKFSLENEYGNNWLIQPDLRSFAPPAFSQKTHWEQQRVIFRFGLEF